MDHGALTAAIAAVLVVAVLLGWALRWIYGRIDGAGPRSVMKTEDIASKLHAAEEARRKAELRFAKVEGDLKARLSDMDVELAATLQSLAAAQRQTEEIRIAYRETMNGRDQR